MRLDTALKGSYQHYIVADFLSTEFFNKRVPLIVCGVNTHNIQDVKDKIADVYGDIAFVVEYDGVAKECTTVDCINDCLCESAQTSVVIDAQELTDGKRFDFSDFVQIMKRLRQKDGCEWDRAQTHESIRINLIEEAYELVEAIDCKNRDMMLEESGDVLMQAVFHTAIAEENGEFSFGDMLTAVCRKLIDRHTHIFGTNHADNPEQALAFWTEAKKKEKKYSSASDAMGRVPKNLPSLLYAEKIQKIARKNGFDWEDAEGALAKIAEETNELITADDAHRVEEAGDLLFAVVNALRLYKVEPEMALHGANEKFLRRFEQMENIVRADGKELKDLTLVQLDEIWDRVKAQEK